MMKNTTKCLFPKVAVPAPEMGDGIYKLTSGEYNYKHAYHTRCPWSPDGEKLLFLRYKKEDDLADICIMDLNSGEIEEIGKTNAWYTHSAATQEWISNEEVLYPEFNSETHAMSLTICNITSGKKKRIPYNDWAHGNVPWNLPETVYKFDSSAVEEVLPDNKSYDRSKVGIKRTNLTTGKQELIITLEDIIARHPKADEIKTMHLYTKMEIPHPSLKRILFGLVNSVYNQVYNEPRIREIFTADWDGGNLRYIGKYLHHPMWHHTEPLIIANVLDFNNCVRLGSYRDQEKSMLKYFDFKGSGHPSFSPCGNLISTDDYIENGIETNVEIKLMNIDTNQTKVIASYKMCGSEIAYGVYEALKNSSEDESVAAIFKKSVFNHDNNDPACSWSTQAHPVWSRDSKYLLFNADTEGTSQLYIVDVDKV